MALRWEVVYDIFLDIHKTYDNLDRDRFLDILVAYGVAPWYLCLLRHYWAILMTVVRAGEYFGTPSRVIVGSPRGTRYIPQYLMC